MRSCCKAHHLQRCYHCSSTCVKRMTFSEWNRHVSEEQLSNSQYSRVPRVNFLTDGNHGIICWAIRYLWSWKRASSIWTYCHQEGLQANDVTLSTLPFHKHHSSGRAHYLHVHDDLCGVVLNDGFVHLTGRRIQEIKAAGCIPRNHNRHTAQSCLQGRCAMVMGMYPAALAQLRVICSGKRVMLLCMLCRAHVQRSAAEQTS